MKNRWYLLVGFIVLSALYHLEPIEIDIGVSGIFITISTFLFAILAGFFISRQSSRYSELRTIISEFDGNMSALYRSFGFFGEAQKEAGRIIAAYYRAILENHRWDWHFTRKSTTITDLNRLFATLETGGKGVLQATVVHMSASLDALQIARKKMVGLHIERIPLLEKVLISFLAFLLVFSLLLAPSAGLLGSILKGVFGIVVVLVVVLLRELDDLKLFEGTLGENSARDVVDIIEGTR